jgi:chemotaxis protein MotB
MLNTINQKVIIGGHTDNSRISTPEFPSNWDLSSKRSVNFMKYLFQREPTLRPERFSAVGYGEYQPLVPNYTDEGRQRNRRVEIMILRNYRPPAGAQLQK